MELVNIADYINTSNVELMLKLGEFYDLITEIVEKPVLCYFLEEEIVKAYNNLPSETHALLDTFLHNELDKCLLEALMSESFSPFRLHHTLEKLARWINNSFLLSNASLIRTVCLKSKDIEDLNNAYEYGYISTDDYTSNIKEHIDRLTTWELAKFITEPYDKMFFLSLL